MKTGALSGRRSTQPDIQTREPVKPVAERETEDCGVTFRRNLRRIVGSPTFNQFFEESAFHAEDDTLRVIARTPFACKHIEANFTPQLLKAAEAAGRPTAHVRVVLTAKARVNEASDPG